MTEEETMDAGALRVEWGFDKLLDIEHEDDGSWSVSIKAMPGHVGAAMTLPQAFIEANDAAEAWVAAAREPVAPAEAEPPTACQQPVWDGPYRMTCGRQLVNGECGRHGRQDALAQPPVPAEPGRPPLDPAVKASDDAYMAGLIRGRELEREAAALAQPPAPVSAETAARDDLLETAWGIIANASSGNWSKQSQEWQAAAKRWRTAYFDRAAIQGTTAGTPLDVELLVKALAAVDERIAVEFPEEATEMRSDEAALGRRSYAEAVAVEYAVALRGQPSETPAAGDGEAGA